LEDAVTDIESRLAAVEERLKRLDELEAKEAIRDGLYRYARAIDRCDVELLKSCYHPGAPDYHGVFAGKAEDFCIYMPPEMKRYRSVRHTLTNPLIELDGDRAFVETFYWCVLFLDAAGGQGNEYVEQVAYGRYLDIWERRAGEWKIAYRRLVSDGATLRLITDQPAFQRIAGVSGEMGPEDLVYRGFDLARTHDPDRQEPGLADRILEAFQDQIDARRAAA
jgi:hypothetical protein